MPAFGSRIDDSQAAAVLTYIRNSWGNAAPPVAASTIAKQRASLVAAP
jgi:mono/diheme cytochrome c family protein